MSPKRGEKEGSLDQGLDKRNVLCIHTNSSSMQRGVCTILILFTSDFLHLTRISHATNCSQFFKTGIYLRKLIISVVAVLSDKTCHLT